MAPSRRKKIPSARPTKKAPASPALDPFQAGMPALDSITSVDEFRKGKKVFRIIHTNEVDEYELPQPKVKRRKK